MKKPLIIAIALLLAGGALYTYSSRGTLFSKIPTPQGVKNAIQSAMPSTPPLFTHPLMISELRKQEFPGSKLVVEETLAPGSNYNRYIVSYQSEGNKIYALLTTPQGEKPKDATGKERGWPVVIFNHGYIPPAQYRTTERYIAYTDGFSRNGYIVFRSDYRGHGSSEGEARGGYGSNDYTIDVLNGMNSVKRHKDADPDRVGMWGHSMGGYITLRSMVVDPSIKAGVIWGGVVASYPDMLARWRRGLSGAPSSAGTSTAPVPSTSVRAGWRQDFIRQFGTPDENSQFWRSISANTYVSDIGGPIQLHHGSVDESVPAELSEILKKELDAAGKPGELFVYPGDDHDITTNFGTAMQRSIEFFDTHVKGE